MLLTSSVASLVASTRFVMVDTMSIVLARFIVALMPFFSGVGRHTEAMRLSLLELTFISLFSFRVLVIGPLAVRFLINDLANVLVAVGVI